MYLLGFTDTLPNTEIAPIRQVEKKRATIRFENEAKALDGVSLHMQMKLATDGYRHEALHLYCETYQLDRRKP